MDKKSSTYAGTAGLVSDAAGADMALVAFFSRGSATWRRRTVVMAVFASGG